jgi:hemerythrin-like domain-containing protein
VIEPKDVEEFMLYAKTWVKNLHGHHGTEEEVAFPLIEDQTRVDGIMNANIVQHEAFGPGVDKFSEYIEAVLDNKSAYDDRKFVELIDDFAIILTAHLADEINTILSLERYEIDWDLCNKRITDHAIQTLNMVSLHLVTAPWILADPLGF